MCRGLVWKAVGKGRFGVPPSGPQRRPVLASSKNEPPSVPACRVCVGRNDAVLCAPGRVSRLGVRLRLGARARAAGGGGTRGAGHGNGGSSTPRTRCLLGVLSPRPLVVVIFETRGTRYLMKVLLRFAALRPHGLTAPIELILLENWLRTRLLFLNAFLEAGQVRPQLLSKQETPRRKARMWSRKHLL